MMVVIGLLGANHWYCYFAFDIDKNEEPEPTCVTIDRCQPSRNRAGYPAFWLISHIPVFSPERPAFLALF